MADAMFLVVLGGAFAALAGLVRVCDRIVRSGDDEAVAAAPETAAPQTPAATIGAGDGR